MICPKCGAENAEGSAFCIKCGANLKEIETATQEAPASIENNQNESVQQVTATPVQESVQEPVQTAPVQEATPVVQQPVVNTQQTKVSVNTSPLNYFMFMIAVLLKPFKSFKDEESKFANAKNSLIFSLIISGIATVVKVITSIINTVRVYKYVDYQVGFKYIWEWDNLKDIKWLELIGKNFLIYAGIIFGIAVIFYIGSLIIKKPIEFLKALAISATAAIPMILGTMILAPIGSLIWVHLSVIFTVAGLAYSFVVFHELINDQLALSGDIKVYFNFACYAVIVSAAYFIILKVIMSELTSGLGSLSSLLG